MKYDGVGKGMIKWLREKSRVSDNGRRGPEVVVEKAKLAEIADYLESLDGRVAHWVWDENAYDWGLGQWVCSNCKCNNDNLGGNKNISPYMFAGSHYCPQCGFKMEEKK